MTSSAAAAQALIRRETRILAPPLAPELKHYGVDEETALWTATEAVLEEKLLPPPFWAFAWPGGQALARLLLDEPGRARGKRVLALAAGAGLEAIAAAKAGARSVVANDIDPFACAAAEMNARLNDVALATDQRDLLNGSTEARAALAQADLLLVGDAFYERALTERFIAAIEIAAGAGAQVLLGDAGRAGAEADTFLARCRRLAAYVAPTNAALEDVDARPVRVLAFLERVNET